MFWNQHAYAVWAVGFGSFRILDDIYNFLTRERSGVQSFVHRRVQYELSAKIALGLLRGRGSMLIEINFDSEVMSTRVGQRFYSYPYSRKRRDYKTSNAFPILYSYDDLYVESPN